MTVSLWLSICLCECVGWREIAYCTVHHFLSRHIRGDKIVCVAKCDEATEKEKKHSYLMKDNNSPLSYTQGVEISSSKSNEWLITHINTFDKYAQREYDEMANIQSNCHYQEARRPFPVSSSNSRQWLIDSRFRPATFLCNLFNAVWLPHHLLTVNPMWQPKPKRCHIK